MAIVAVVLLALSALSGVAGLHARAIVTPTKGEVRSQATVIDLIDVCGGACAYAPLLSFSTATGEHVEVQGLARSLPPAIGQTEAIAYDPANPLRVHDVGAGSRSWVTDMVVSGVLALLSLLTCLATPSVARAVRRRQGQSRRPSRSHRLTWL